MSDINLTEMIIQQLTSTEFSTARDAGYTIKGINNLLKSNGLRWRDVIKGEEAAAEAPKERQRKDLSPLTYEQCEILIKDVRAHTRDDSKLVFHDSLRDFLDENGGLTEKQVVAARQWIGRAFRRYR